MNEDVLVFLAGYKPEDDMYTSIEEIKLVTDKLGLNWMSIDELCKTRDQVVKVYRDLMEDHRVAIGMDDRFFNLMTAMQSVTSVIDYVKIQNGHFNRV